jgi:hypothetical protein
LIRLESKLAKQHESEIVSQSTHLTPLMARAPKVWIMGYLELAAATRLNWKEIGWIFKIDSNGRGIDGKHFLFCYFTHHSKHFELL